MPRITELPEFPGDEERPCRMPAQDIRRLSQVTKAYRTRSRLPQLDATRGAGARARRQQAEVRTTDPCWEAFEGLPGPSTRPCAIRPGMRHQERLIPILGLAGQGYRVCQPATARMRYSWPSRRQPEDAVAFGRRP